MRHPLLHLLMLVTAAVALFATITPLRASETDDRIEAAFKQTYAFKTYLKEDSITAEAEDGVVILTGTVADDSHKVLAQETVASLPGVTKVDNRLATKVGVATDSSDTWISSKVKLALLFHRHVDAGNTVVMVKDGIVTLKGEAASSAQKELTTEYAKDIDGVKEVKNEMTVAVVAAKPERTQVEKIDDASITGQVRTALRTHRSTSSLSTTVVTRKGEVTLTGIAKNAAEKALVTKLVTDIQGVTEVDNQMTLEVARSK